VADEDDRPLADVVQGPVDEEIEVVDDARRPGRAGLADAGGGRGLAVAPVVGA